MTDQPQRNAAAPAPGPVRGVSTAGLRITSRPYYACRHLLSPGERRFLHEGLSPAIGARYLVSFKVRLADVIRADHWDSPHGRRIAQKHLDFVLLTPSLTRIVAAVELNDATHQTDDRRERDLFIAEALRAAGVALIVFPVYARYDPAKIRRRVLGAIGAAHRLDRKSH